MTLCRMSRPATFSIRFMRLKEGEYKYMGRGAGYDFEILGDKIKTMGKYIEAKVIKNEQQTCRVSRTGYKFAKNNKDDYYLFIIDRSYSRPITYKIPLGKLQREPDYYGFKFRQGEIKNYEYER